MLLQTNNSIESDDFEITDSDTETISSMEHSYSKDYRSAEGVEVMTTKTLMVHRPPQCPSCHLHSNDEGVDMGDSYNRPMPKYNEEIAKTAMDECERVASSIRNIVPEDADWEEQLNKICWTPQQQRLFTRVSRILDLDHLARLANRDRQHEAVLRRVVIDKSVSRLRQALSSVSWDTVMIQWLHRLLMDKLPPSYMASYLDILQTLKSKVPSLVDKMMLNCPVNNNESLLQLFQRDAWEPVIAHKSRKLPGQAVIVIVPSSPIMLSPSTRLQKWYSLLATMANVVPIQMNISGSIMQKQPLDHVAEQMVAISRAKIQEIRNEVTNRQIILVGFNAGASLALQIALLETVNSIICMGFAYNTINGVRGAPDDRILDVTTPVLFVLGQNSSRSSQEEIESLREKMSAQTSLVVVGSADDALRVEKRKRVIESVTQTMVDNMIMEEIAEFANTCIVNPPGPREPKPIAGISTKITSIQKISNGKIIEKHASIKESTKPRSSVCVPTTKSQIANTTGKKRQNTTQLEAPKKAKMIKTGKKYTKSGCVKNNTSKNINDPPRKVGRPRLNRSEDTSSTATTTTTTSERKHAVGIQQPSSEALDIAIQSILLPKGVDESKDENIFLDDNPSTTTKLLTNRTSNQTQIIKTTITPSSIPNKQKTKISTSGNNSHGNNKISSNNNSSSNFIVQANGNKNKSIILSHPLSSTSLSLSVSVPITTSSMTPAAVVEENAQRSKQTLKVVPSNQFLQLNPSSGNTQKIYFKSTIPATVSKSTSTSIQSQQQPIYTIKTNSSISGSTVFANSSTSIPIHSPSTTTTSTLKTPTVMSTTNLSSNNQIRSTKIVTIKTTKPIAEYTNNILSNSIKSNTSPTVLINSSKYTILKPNNVPSTTSSLTSTNKIVLQNQSIPPDLSSTNIFDIPIVFADNDDINDNNNVSDNPQSNVSNPTPIIITAQTPHVIKNISTGGTKSVPTNTLTLGQQSPQTRSIIINNILNKNATSNQKLYNNALTATTSNGNKLVFITRNPNMAPSIAATTTSTTTTPSNQLPALKYTKIALANPSNIIIPSSCYQQTTSTTHNSPVINKSLTSTSNYNQQSASLSCSPVSTISNLSSPKTNNFITKIITSSPQASHLATANALPVGTKIELINSKTFKPISTPTTAISNTVKAISSTNTTTTGGGTPIAILSGQPFRAYTTSLPSTTTILNNTIIKSLNISPSIPHIPMTRQIINNGSSPNLSHNKSINQPIVINVDSGKATFKNIIKVGDTNIKQINISKVTASTTSTSTASSSTKNRLILKPTGNLKTIPILNRNLTVRKIVNIVHQQNAAQTNNSIHTKIVEGEKGKERGNIVVSGGNTERIKGGNSQITTNIVNTSKNIPSSPINDSDNDRISPIIIYSEYDEDMEWDEEMK